MNKYTTNKKMYINDRDNSPSKYCISGEYWEIDPEKIDFNEWKIRSLKRDPSIDMTYWVFDIKISNQLKSQFKEVDKFFKQDKYIITNRRIVHVFSNDPYYHASGFHTKPDSIVEMLKGLFMPDEITFSKGKGPIFYGLKNNENKIKSFLNVQDNKYLKIQTSYLNESVSLIEDLAFVYTNNIDLFNQEVALNEEYLKPLQEKYLLVEKFLYTYNPNVVALGNSVLDYDGIKSLSLDEEQIPIILKHIDFIQEEVGCSYMIEGYDLILILK